MPYTNTPTYSEKIRCLPWSYLSNAANSAFAFLTVFGSIFVIFLDKLGLPKDQIGFILSLFPFCGIIALFIGPGISRYGLKRTFVLMWGTRKVITCLLLLTPLVLSNYGKWTAFIFVAAVIMSFAICRAIGETAFYPWMQEAVPNSIRGRFNATNATVGNVVALITVALSGWYIGHHTGLKSFIILIAIGVGFGVVAVWASTKIPGGAPRISEKDDSEHFKGMLEAATDRNFKLFLIGYGLITFSAGIAGFIPLYLTHEIGISSSRVVMISVTSSLGALAGYMWGWASDRFGGKPVAVICLVASAVFPVLYILIPRSSFWSIFTTILLLFGSGLFAAGVTTATQQIMYINLVPLEKNTRYMSLYYAWVGLVGGISPIVAGAILEKTKSFSSKIGTITLDSYTILFVLSTIAYIISLLVMRAIRIKSNISAGRLAGMFVRGNPLAAAGSIVRHMLAKDEHSRILTTERMGITGSPLAVDELIESMQDPSYNVRYEAVISIARAGASPRSIDALVAALRQDDPGISLASAWALSKIGDSSAVAALRQTLAGGFPLLKAASARALAALNDRESIDVIRNHFEAEPDITIKTIYASALGTLGVREEISGILALLHSTEQDLARRELSMSVAKLINRDYEFVRLLRETSTEPGSALSRETSVLMSKFRKHNWFGGEISETLNRCNDAFSQNDIRYASSLIADILYAIVQSLEGIETTAKTVSTECIKRLRENDSPRIEYVILALQLLEILPANYNAARK